MPKNTGEREKPKSKNWIWWLLGGLLLLIIIVLIFVSVRKAVNSLPSLPTANAPPILGVSPLPQVGGIAVQQPASGSGGGGLLSGVGSSLPAPGGFLNPINILPGVVSGIGGLFKR